jgi:hypothetical protein
LEESGESCCGFHCVCDFERRDLICVCV